MKKDENRQKAYLYEERMKNIDTTIGSAFEDLKKTIFRKHAETLSKQYTDDELEIVVYKLKEILLSRLEARAS